MTGDLFTGGGPEGRNQDADEFERRMRLMAPELGYEVVEANVDTLIGETGRSQGLDAIWACPNPRTTRADGWLFDAKRHDGPRPLHTGSDDRRGADAARQDPPPQ
jgi:hypothetical protein